MSGDIDRIKNLTHCLRLMIGGIVFDHDHEPMTEEDLGALQELSFRLSDEVNAYYDALKMTDEAVARRVSAKPAAPLTGAPLKENGQRLKGC